MSTKKTRGIASLLGKSLEAPPSPTTPGAVRENPTSAGAMFEGESRGYSRGHPTVWLDPDICIPWAQADRFESDISGEALEALVADFKNKDVGQKTPALVRKIRDAQAGGPRYEVIAGRRRLEAAKLAGVRLLALIEGEDFDDKAAFAAMVSENDDRSDITEFERAMSFARAMEAGIYENYEQLIARFSREANKRRYTKDAISMMLGATGLREFPRVWKAFQGRRDIPIRPAYELVRQMRSSEVSAEAVARRIETLGDRVATMRSAEILRDLREALARSKKAGATAGAPKKEIAIAGLKAPMTWERKKGKFTIEAPDESLKDEVALIAAIKQAIDKARGA